MRNATLYLSASPFETRVALREDGRLVTYRVERTQASSRVGNVYKGRVSRVLPGMQAAFVDIGLGRDAFLYVREASGVFEHFSDLFAAGEQDEPADPAKASIGDLLQVGQEVLVQVVKDELGGKGARITTHVALPGRFLVYLPSDSQVGVSRRIEDTEVREKLRRLGESFHDAGGWIIRTAAADQENAGLAGDRDELLARWVRLQAAAARSGAPALLHRELAPALRTVRDLLSAGVDECWLDNAETYREVDTYLEGAAPALRGRLRLHNGSGDLMAAFAIDRELEKALRPRVWLKSGGYVVVNQTEALVAIDVNTGKYVGSTSLEDTVFRINLEAVREIVRQLRLRDLGGIVVIDFIDMEEAEHRQRLYDALAAELARDPARSTLLPMTEIGLVQLTRKRARPSLDRVLNRECPCCHGSGRVRSLTTTCLDLRRAVLEAAPGRDGGDVVVEVHPEVVAHLAGPFKSILSELADEHGITVEVRSNPALPPWEFVVR